MALNYRARQSVLENEEGEKLWYPTLVKEGGLITLEMIAEKIVEKSSLTRGDVYNAVDCLIGELNDKLMNGHSVRLDGFGTFTASIKASGNGVKDPKDVNSSQIKTMGIRFIPSAKRTPMQGMTRALFAGVEFRRWSGDPYAPNYKYAGKDTSGNNNEDDDYEQDPNA